MLLEDVTIEVRDSSLVRIGQLTPDEATFELYPVFSDVGSWKLTLSAEHPLALTLRTPGAGIIATGPSDVILSGPVTGAPFEASIDDPVGTVSFEGITDEHVLRDRLSYPLPTTADVTAQTSAHDQRTGNTEALLHAYVNANVGPSAPTARKNANLTLGTNSNRGSTQTKKPRFQQLLNLLQEIVAGESLGFRVVQRGDVLVFETYAVADLRGTIRLSAENNTLAGQKVNVQAPGATRIIVAGQGEQVDRTFKEVTSTDSLAAESSWSRRIEEFKDERNTDVDAELLQAGLDELADHGSTILTVQAIPADDEGNMQLGTDWGLGDLVTVVVEDQELSDVVTGLAIKADQESGFKCGVIIGDPTGFNYNALVRKRLKSQSTRISNLERNAEVSATIGADVASLQSDVAANTSDISTAQADVSSLMSDVTNLETRTTALEITHKVRRLLVRTVTFSAATGSLIPVGTWTADTGDDGELLGLSLSNTTLTVATGQDGVYTCHFSMFFAANATGTRQVSLWKNAIISGGVVTSGTQVGFTQVPGLSAGGVSVEVNRDVYLAAGDTITPVVQQTSGGALTCGSTAAGAVVFQVRKADVS